MIERIAIVFLCLLCLVGCAVPTPPPATLQTVPQTPVPLAPVQRQACTGTLEDARKHMLRGMAAVEMAKSPTEITMAADEFRCATEITPQLANAWYNLARAQSQLGKYRDAIASYQRYLEVAPNAEDAQKVRDELIKLEFRQEVADKTQGRAGLWIGSDGTYYEMTVNGDSLTLRSKDSITPEDEIISTYPIVGSMQLPPVSIEYQLTQQGNMLSGVWHRAPVTAEKCIVPADSSTVSGEVDDANHRIILRHEVTSFHASTMMSILADDFCGGVQPKGRKSKELAIYGSFSKPDLGGVSFSIKPMHNWFDGGLFIKRGWHGRLGIFAVPDGSPAYQAGLRSDDEILAIDGRPVSGMNAGEAVMALRGAPGSQVRLEIWRKDSPQTIVINMTRHL